jgi:hypothetical protein
MARKRTGRGISSSPSIQLVSCFTGTRSRRARVRTSPAILAASTNVLVRAARLIDGTHSTMLAFTLPLCAHTLAHAYRASWLAGVAGSRKWMLGAATGVSSQADTSFPRRCTGE